MTWKIDAALAVLAAPASGILEALGKRRAGILLLFAAFAAGAGGATASLVFLSDLKTWGPRITTLEQRFEAHVDTVSTPGLARIAELERRQNEFRALWDREWDLDRGGRLAVMAEQTHQTYCTLLPARCRPVPRDGR